MKIITILFITFYIFSCETKKNDDEDLVQINFSEINSTYLEERWGLDPKTATHFGFEKYNDQLFPFTTDYMNDIIYWAKDKLSDLDKIDYFSLSDSEKIDFELIKNDLEGTLFWIGKMKFYTWNPEIYNLYTLFVITLNGSDPLEKKLYNVNERLKIVPEFLQIGQENLVNPSKESTISTISRLESKIGILENMIKDSIKVSNLSENKKEKYIENLNKSIVEQKEFIQFLEYKLNSDETEFRSFRIGKDLYPEFFKSYISKWINEKQTNDIAINYKNSIRKKMADITIKLWPKYFPNQMMPEINIAINMLANEISKFYTLKNYTVTDINQLLLNNVNYVNENRLIFHENYNLPKLNIEEISSNPEQVRFSILENISTNDLINYPVYNIQTVNSNSKYQEINHYKKFNKFTLELLSLNIIPGYYTKYLHAPKDISDVKTIFRKGSNKNGWAAYAQQMMITNGYENNELKDELLLIHYKYQLRMVCNSIITYQTHVNNWTKKQVADLLINEAFMEQVEAESEWETLTDLGAELTGSFNGFIEIIRLRDEIQVLEGEFFDLEKFHEEFLSYGYAPIDIIRHLMLQKYNDLSYYQISAPTFLKDYPND